MTVLCVDFGSTFTKVSWVDPDDRELRATVSHPTTLDIDVLDGLAHCQAELASRGCRVRDAEVIACSSAGGGLRIAVIGNEELVSSEAGRRVSLSSGGHVVAVFSGAPDRAALDELRRARADLVLLVGGTDGGNAATLLAAATSLGRAGPGLPVVVAGNTAVSEEVGHLLADVPHKITANVVPEIGVFTPDPARACVREMFLRHVIGGKGLSRSREFATMVRGATPDVVLAGVQTVADGNHDVVVVDIGGATTDVHSVVQLAGPEAERDEGLSREVIAPTPATRTVEGDLGLRWSAETTATVGAEEGLLDAGEQGLARRWAEQRPMDRLPGTADESRAEALLGGTAAAAALRRHAGRSEAILVAGQRVVRRTGVDIREAEVVIGSGGLLRADATAGADLIRHALTRAAGPGRLLPTEPSVQVDADYRLAPIGLLARSHPHVAAALAESLRPAARLGG